MVKMILKIESLSELWLHLQQIPITTYDTGLKPFNHDKNRGRWSSSKDFLFACIGHAFKVDAIFILPAILFRELGIWALIPYFIILAICVIPIVFIQSFLGQFSSTGFISVFRISPLFKGIGYVSLAINLTTLAYYSIFGAIPLFYFFHSLRPTIPWSCEGARDWMKIDENITTVCSENKTTRNFLVIPSVEFFKVHLNHMDMYDRSHPEGTFSWSLMICTFIIWAMVATVLIKPVEFIGRFLRYSFLAVIGIMSLCLLRMVFLPGAFVGLKEFIQPTYSNFIETWAMVPVIALSALGPGWGSILTMASYNNFKTNIFRYSWILCLAQVGIVLGLSFLSIFITHFMQRDDPDHIYFQYIYTQWNELLIIPTGLTFFELPHFWSLIFFGMLILGSSNLLIVQLFSVLTSLFDEFEILRSLKREFTLAAVGALAVASIYFCSNFGVTFFEILIKYSIMTQMILNLLLLLVVLWIYGRERLQRDVQFMTSRFYSTWMVNILRYVAPIFLLLGWLIGCVISINAGRSSTWLMVVFVVTVVLLPWFFIPGYCIFKIMQTTGMFGIRFRRCVRPTDWYPVDPLDRQRYEEAFNNADISHQLTTDILE